MAATAGTCASGYDVAIIGGGIAGCAAARSLTLNDPTNAKVTVYEIGRGPGGRASTRRTRAIPAVRINHGAPYADISTLEGKELVRDLELTEFEGRHGYIDDLSGAFTPSDEDEDVVFVTGSNNEMSNVASSLISTASTPITTRYSSMVRSLSRTPSSSSNGRWQLHDKSGATVGSADYLIVAGSSVAHPRWTETFGGDPPLVAAAATSGIHDDAILNGALASIALQKADPILAVFFYRAGESATPWTNLGFQVAKLRNKNDDGHEVLSKIIVQPSGDGCSVVLHSTVAFARANTGVYGSTSSAARVGDASSDSSREELIIAEMLRALSVIPGMPAVDISDGDNSAGCGGTYGPLLHRWGNAFPSGAPLAHDLALCPSSRVGFCGDYTETEARMGSVEAALLSGASIGERIAQLANTDGAVDGIDR